MAGFDKRGHRLLGRQNRYRHVHVAMAEGPEADRLKRYAKAPPPARHIVFYPERCQWAPMQQQHLPRLGIVAADQPMHAITRVETMAVKRSCIDHDDPPGPPTFARRNITGPIAGRKNPINEPRDVSANGI